MTTDTHPDEILLLDLLNSTPLVDGMQRDALGTPAAARRWLREHGGTGSPAEWRAVRQARTALWAVCRGGQDATVLAPILRGTAYRPTVGPEGVEWALDAAAGRALAARAVLAWDGVRRTSPGRLRACENPECTLFLIDHSKPNTARWCSMAVCGNRMKARRHYERTHRSSTARSRRR